MKTMELVVNPPVIHQVQQRDRQIFVEASDTGVARCDEIYLTHAANKTPSHPRSSLLSRHGQDLIFNLAHPIKIDNIRRSRQRSFNRMIPNTYPRIHAALRLQSPDTQKLSINVCPTDNDPTSACKRAGKELVIVGVFG